MTFTLILEQAFNGLQAGVTLFLVAAGLTLILGIMDVVFLAHGAQVMIGAYAAAAIAAALPFAAWPRRCRRVACRAGISASRAAS